MSNPLVSKPNFQNGNQINLEELFRQFKENPTKYLAGLNLPPDVQTPEQAVRYLVANNKIPPLIQQQVYGMLNKK